MNNLSQEKRILLIEDNADDQESFVRACRKAGLNVPIMWCRSGEDALTQLNAHTNTAENPYLLPSLIVLDLNMPGTDGREILHILKEDKLLKKIPIVVLTTSANDKDINHCYQIGANTYIQKPLRFSDLITYAERLKLYWMEMAILPTLGKSVGSLS